jgi:tuftelin-interacting protein 11
MTEAQLQRLDAKLQHDQDTAAILANERKLLQQEVDQRAEGMQRLETLHARLRQLQAAAGGNGDGSSAEAAAAAWAHLKREYAEEYVLFGLAAAALPAALPALTAALAGWAPLAAPVQGAGEFGAWRPLLETSQSKNAVLGGGGEAGSEDPYTAVVEELVLPAVRWAFLD